MVNCPRDRHVGPFSWAAVFGVPGSTREASRPRKGANTAIPRLVVSGGSFATHISARKAPGPKREKTLLIFISVWIAREKLA